MKNNQYFAGAVALAMMLGAVGCNRDSAKSPDGGTTRPAAATISSDPRKHLADSFANLWDVMQKERDSHRPGDDWVRALADTKTPEAIAARRFKSAAKLLLAQENNGADTDITAQALDGLIVE